MSYFPHQFDAVVDKYDFGPYYYMVVYLPADLIAQLPLRTHPRLRVEAEVDDIPIHGALMPDGGIWYLMTPRKLLKTIGKSLGDEVAVRLRVADQDAVDVPDALQAMLDETPAASAVWEALTPGKRRGYAHTVGSAKTAPTRAKRVEALRELLLRR